MRLYADTSWWLAYKCRRDTHHDAAITIFDHDPAAQVIWTPWQRIEIFNTFLQAERTALIGRGEARQIIRLLEQEVRLGYWPHVEFEWTDAIRTACDLALEHSPTMLVRGMDLFHVAVAIQTRVEGFLSFDEEQNAFAQAAGLRLVWLRARAR